MLRAISAAIALAAAVTWVELDVVALRILLIDLRSWAAPRAAVDAVRASEPKRCTRVSVMAAWALPHPPAHITPAHMVSHSLIAPRARLRSCEARSAPRMPYYSRRAVHRSSSQASWTLRCTNSRVVQVTAPRLLLRRAGASGQSISSTDRRHG